MWAVAFPSQILQPGWCHETVTGLIKPRPSAVATTGYYMGAWPCLLTGSPCSPVDAPPAQPPEKMGTPEMQSSQTDQHIQTPLVPPLGQRGQKHLSLYYYYHYHSPEITRQITAAWYATHWERKLKTHSRCLGIKWPVITTWLVQGKRVAKSQSGCQGRAHTKAGPDKANAD